MEQVVEALERHRAPKSPTVFEGAVRSAIYELASGGPWLLEAAILAGMWLVLVVRACACRVLRAVMPSSQPVQYHAVRRRLR